MNGKRILVIGSTGQQGGSVINALLNNGHDIVGLTRNNMSDRAKALSDSPDLEWSPDRSRLDGTDSRELNISFINTEKKHYMMFILIYIPSIIYLLCGI